MATQETPHFGFTRVGDGESLAKNGWAATDLDALTLDDLLRALEFHTHDALPRLSDPAEAPVLSLGVGGALPAGTTFYYLISYVDAHGLETAASPETSIDTPVPLEAPGAPVAEVQTGGAIGPGYWVYALSAVSAVAGGETTAGAICEVRVDTGADNRIAITLPGEVPGVFSYRLYRSRPGQTELYLVAELPAGTPGYSDTGAIEDATISPPVVNTTNADSAVTITLPGAVTPQGVAAWNIYRATTPGLYEGANLVHRVVEGLGELTNTPRPSWVDEGAQLSRGAPRRVSATISGGRTITLDELGGTFPLAAMPRGARRWDSYAATPVLGRRAGATVVSTAISPSRLSAHFDTAPQVEPTGAQVGFEITDTAGASVRVLSDGTASGFYLAAYPLTVGGAFQAEETVQDNWTEMTIVDDYAARNGQAVELDDLDEYVERSVGTLDPGTYTATARVRTTPATGTGLRITAQAGGVVLATLDVPAPGEDTYLTTPPLSFTVPAPGREVVLRATKTAEDSTVFDVDAFTYATTVPALAAGTITVATVLGVVPGTERTPPPAPAPGSALAPRTQTVLVREGIETGVEIGFSTTPSTPGPWSASTAQSWVSPSPNSGTGPDAAITATVDFSALPVGSRAEATVTVTTAAGAYDVALTALRAPAALGSGVNISVQY